MNLISDWKLVIRKAWSFRLAILAGALSGIEAILPLFVDSFPRGVFAVLSIFASIGALVARLVAQPKMRQNEQG